MANKKRIRKPLTKRQLAQRRVRRRHWKQYAVLNVSKGAYDTIQLYCKGTGKKIGPWCEAVLMRALARAIR